MHKLMVIDDDESIRVNVVELLEAEGFEVHSAPDGRAGVQLARQHLPDLIVCDILMPGLDGYGVLAELRQESATAMIPFVFLTARADKSDVRRGMEQGADDYLVKPFTRDELLRAIAARLAKQGVVAYILQSRLDSLRGSIALALPHELRTPLASIEGYSELMVEDCASLQPSNVCEMARGINSSARRLHELVLNFLLYAELEIAARDSGYAHALMDATPSRIDQVVTEVALFQAQQARREVDLSLEVEDAVTPIASNYLEKIIQELARNAFKFSRAGTPVSIAGRRNGATYRLSIQDCGRGMTPEQIADVGAYLQFERKRHEQQGSGLGLILAKRIAELHGGALSIESVYGQETTVHVTLPLTRDSAMHSGDTC